MGRFFLQVRCQQSCGSIEVALGGELDGLVALAVGLMVDEGEEGGKVGEEGFVEVVHVVSPKLG